MKKLLNGCEAVLTYAAVISTFVIMCLTTADAVGRYFFSRPITGAFEITTNYLMVAAVFLSLGYSYRKGIFIRVTLLSDHMPKQVKLVVNYFVQLISMLFGIILIIATIKQAFYTINTRANLGTINFPLGPAQLIIPVGLFFMSLLMILDLRRVKAGESSLFKEESPSI